MEETYTLILRDSTISGLLEKNMYRNRKIKVRYFQGTKIKDMYRYAIPLLENKQENVLLYFSTNDAACKSGTNILKDLIELKHFILEKSPRCNKLTLSPPTDRTDKESAKKNNEILTNRLKEQGIPYITHDNIIHKHLYRNGLHLNSADFSCLAENFLSFFWRNRLQTETQNQRKNKEVNSSKITTESSDDIIDGVKTLHLKYLQNLIIAKKKSSRCKTNFKYLYH